METVGPDQFRYTCVISEYPAGSVLQIRTVSRTEIDATLTVSSKNLVINAQADELKNLSHGWPTNRFTVSVVISNSDFGVSQQQIGKTSAFSYADVEEGNVRVPFTVGLYNTSNYVDAVVTIADNSPAYSFTVSVPSSEWNRLVLEMMKVYPITPKTSPVNLST